ncbi:MAG TPA: hypothetical protein VGD62_04520 [Acidobacteriaceae bacterium]
MGFPPYKRYTTCIDAAFFDKSSVYVQATIVSAGVVTPLGVMAALVDPLCLLALIPVAAAAWIVGYCYWFLHQRLICLPPPLNLTQPDGSDQLAIGMVIDLLPPSGNTFPDSLDTDYSFGLLIAPNLPGDSQAAVDASTPYGFLVSQQPATQNIGMPFTGHPGTYQPTGQIAETFHCEFEGAGVHDFLLAASVSLAVAIAAFFVCLFVPFPLGAILALILALLSLIVLAIGAAVGANDYASPADENPALGGELHPGDILVVAGSWVYDSGHQPSGWNEIHPIKFCTPLCNCKGVWPPDLNDLEAFWATALGDATSTTTIELQNQPQNQWQVHPLLDGCEPVVLV